MKIGIVVPCYNSSETIIKTLEGIKSQTFKNYKVVIVNDGSTDNSCEVVNQIKDSRIHLITQQNSGASNARNHGISVSKYEYIALLDADDLWDSNFLEEMFHLMSDYPEASLFGCTWTFVYADGKRAISDFGLPKEFRGYINNYFEIGIQNKLFNSSSVIFNKKSFFELGAFDVSLKRGEDMDLWFRFAFKKKIAYLNKSMSNYILSAENRAMNKTYKPDECLVWNLDRYEKYEISNPIYKAFIDSWRLSHILDFLNGDKTEVTEITSLLNKIDLTKYPKFWAFLKYQPKLFQIFFYKLRLQYQSIYMKIGSFKIAK